MHVHDGKTLPGEKQVRRLFDRDNVCYDVTTRRRSLPLYGNEGGT